MPALAPSIALLGGLVASDMALAQQVLGNFTGFDPAVLAGHICQGSFDTGAGRAESEGALQLSFGISGDLLIVDVWRRFGAGAQNSAAYAITQSSPPFSVRGFQNLGQAPWLKVTNNIVQYIDAAGDAVVLYYDRGWLWGHSNPRGEHNPYMTLIANVTMRCY